MGGGDYVVSRAGALVKVEYTTITGSHCGFHFDAVDKFIIDHLDFSGTNGATTIDKSFTGGKDTLATNAKVTNAATVPVPDAKPR